jgi:hypothetical protein|nr:MAG TPA: hypothetical protein [Caudoviricetes sp.]
MYIPYKQIQDYFYDNNLEQSDTIFNDMDSMAYVLCEVLTPNEKSRAKKSVKNGGFFTFGYNGLYCCNSLKESTVKRFFKVNYGLSFEV